MCVPIAISGSNLTKLYQAMWSEAGVITCVQLLEGVPPTKFGRAKNVQISDFWQFSTLRANNPGEDRHNENLKSKWSTTTPPTLKLKSWRTLVHKQKSYRRAIGLFSGCNISAFRGAVPSKFLHTLQPRKLYFQFDLGAGRPQVWLCPMAIFLVIVRVVFFVLEHRDVPYSDSRKTTKTW